MTTFFHTFFALIVCIALAATASAQPPIERDPGDMIARADTDGDGKVSRDEFIKAQTERLEKMFARMDTDGDGKLDEQEAKAAAERMRAMGGGREGVRRPDGPRPQRPDGERPRGPGKPARGERGPEEGFRKPPQQD